MTTHPISLTHQTVADGGLMEHLEKILGAVAWPIAAIVILLILLKHVEVIGRAFRKAPIVRKLKLSNFEIELSKESTDELKEQTEKSFETLISRTDSELSVFARTIGLEEQLSRFCLDFWSILPNKSRGKVEEAKPRSTLYIHDPIFVDQLYQITPYHYPKNGRAYLLEGKGPGRRFSVRYGIIGLATRSKSSEIIGDAFKGKAEERAVLIREWSMTDAQADSAKDKPSCLAISVFNPQSKAHVGLIYVDAEIENFFCGKNDQSHFLGEIYQLDSFQSLVAALTDMHKLARQIDVRFDLTKIRPNK